MNKFLVSVLMGNVMHCPFVPKRKFNPAVAAAAVPAAIQGGASVLGSIIDFFGGRSATSRTNETNYQIARETNELNKQMHDEDLAWQEKMWNKSNEYNDPLAQSHRLAAAGINPSAVLANSSAVTDVSSPSPAAAVPAVAAKMEPFMPHLGEGIGNSVTAAINQYQNLKYQNENTRMMSAQADMAEFEASYQFVEKYLDSMRKVNDLNRQIYDLERDRHHDPVKLQKMKEEVRSLEESTDDMVATRSLRYRNLGLQNDQIVQAIETDKARQRLYSGQYYESAAAAGLSRATAKRITTLLPFESVSSEYDSAQKWADWLGRVNTGFNNKKEAIEAAKNIVEAAHIKEMTREQKANFENWWKRFIEPCFGSFSSSVSSYVGARYGVGKR